MFYSMYFIKKLIKAHEIKYGKILVAWEIKEPHKPWCYYPTLLYIPPDIKYISKSQEQ